jgi:hypothetical protein
MSNENDISVIVADRVTYRHPGISPKVLDVDVLAQNVGLFLGQMERVVDKAPDDVGEFRLSEFTVTAEISAEGTLALMGTGVKAEATGGLTFTFKRG